ncbi:MAG: SMP-30/gluconolactonase/LRE family protein [Verrucomicrobiota bacterium]
MSALKVEPAGKRVSKWGEGPIWHEGLLYYVDIEGHAIVSYDPNTREEKEWPVEQRVGFVVPSKSNRLLFGGDKGLFFFDTKSGSIKAIHDPEPELPDNRFNDGKCAPDGRLFAGTISLVKKEGSAKLYRLNKDLNCEVAYEPVTNSNGIVWNKVGNICYYIDTPTKTVVAFDYDPKIGSLTNKCCVVDTSFIQASPDGMAIDADDHLWVTFCHGACVIQFDPVAGKQIQKIELPCLETTACCFGGSDLNDLYVTTGIHKTEKEEFAGRLFVIRDVGAKGFAANLFADL